MTTLPPSSADCLEIGATQRPVQGMLWLLTDSDYVRLLTKANALLRSHGNNAYAIVPQCYVIRT
jgi:hypothetical protein